MRRVERFNESTFGIESSTIDPNRFYSILLDAKATSASENMCDIAEKLINGEKENSKQALDYLWRFKKTLFSGKNDTIDLLINYYQEKMDVLREKEEYLKKISLDSRNLLEEKRKKDEEIATVKQQVADCTKELNELNEKLNKLKVKEQELTLIEHQLREELNKNENEIVNGLYEIILRQQEDILPKSAVQATKPEENIELSSPPPVREDTVQSMQTDTSPITLVFEPPVIPQQSILENETKKNIDSIVGNGLHENQTVIQPKTDTKTDTAPFPKSVVKTAAGRVIGEYFFDGKVYKNERNYILDSIFFCEELLKHVRQLKNKFDQIVYNEMMQMIQDAAKRVSENNRLHFAVATNEILNEKTIKRLWQDSKLRSFDEVERFGIRLMAKINSLGNNYIAILREQMERYAKKTT